MTADQFLGIRLMSQKPVVFTALCLIASTTVMATESTLNDPFSTSVFAGDEWTAEEVEYLSAPLFPGQPTLEQSLQVDELLTEDERVKYTEKIYTCRLEPRATTIEIPGHECPSHSPNPFSKVYKYQKRYENFQVKNSKDHTGLRGKEQVFCGENEEGELIVPEFCENEILQLQLDMPKNLSNETAFTVFWGERQSPVPFYCPTDVINRDGPHNATQYCLSQFCRRSYAIRPGDTKNSVGTLFEIDDTWILNLKLREATGRRVLSMRVISCPEGKPPICYLYCKPNQCCCCMHYTSLDIRIVRQERNRFKSPATLIGNGLFNVTIVKNTQYTDLNVTDTLTGENVDFIESEFGPEEYNVTLYQSIFQVTGSTDHTCGSAELSRPITLLPLNATLNPLKFVDFSLRELSWNTHSDIPVKQYEVYPQSDRSKTYITTAKSLVFSIGDNMYDRPSAVELYFAHKTHYEGIDEHNEPIQPFTVNLQDFLPTNITASYNNTHTEVQWRKPANHEDSLELFRLIANKTLTNPDETFDVHPNNKSIQHFTFNHIHPYRGGETLNLTLSAVYKNRDDDAVYWWGPEQTHYVTIAKTPIPSQSSTNAVTTQTTSPAPTVSPASYQQGIIIGASLAGAAVLVTATTGITVTIYFCSKKIKNGGRRLNNPVSDKPT